MLELYVRYDPVNESTLQDKPPVEEPPHWPQKSPVEEPADPPEPPPPAKPPVEEPPNRPEVPPIKEPPPKDSKGNRPAKRR